MNGIKISSIKTSILIGVYVSLGLLIYFGIGKIGYRFDMYQIDMDQIDLSETSSAYEGDMLYAKKQIFGKSDWFSGMLTPFVLISSFFFGICGGAGLAFFPLELLDKYLYRPQLMTSEEYIIGKKVLIEESLLVIKKSKEAYELERDLALLNTSVEKKVELTKKNLINAKYQAKHAFIHFEEMQEAFKADENVLDSNPLVDYCYLVMSIIFIILTGSIVAHTFLGMNGITWILEFVLISVETKQFIVAIILFLGLVFYMGMCILYGSFKLFKILGAVLDTHPVKQEKTYTDSFLLHLTICISGFFGVLMYFVRYLPRYLRNVQYDLFFNRTLVRIKFIHYFYRFKIFEYCLIISFLISVFVSFFVTNGSFDLKARIKAKIEELEKEKSKVVKIEKDSATKLLQK